jgi:transposase
VIDDRWQPGMGSTGSTATPQTGAQRPGRTGAAEAELAALRARVAALETDNATLATERDILRPAAKYFAGETRW